MPHSEARTGRILIVDDQPANLRVVGALLERNGYAVATAGNGPDALAAARSALPGPRAARHDDAGHGRFELLAALKDEPGMRQVPAIFLTAAQDRELLLRAFEAGASTTSPSRSSPRNCWRGSGHRAEADPRPPGTRGPRTPGTGQPGRARPQEPADHGAVRQRDAAIAGLPSGPHAALRGSDPRKRQRRGRLHPSLPGATGAAGRARRGRRMPRPTSARPWRGWRRAMNCSWRRRACAWPARHRRTRARRDRRAGAAAGRREPGQQRIEVRPRWRGAGTAARRGAPGLLAAARRRPRRRYPGIAPAPAVQAVPAPHPG